MWIYCQSEHTLTNEAEMFHTDTCYSGHGEGLNNPKLQDVQSIGPIPQGFYTIDPAQTHPRLGPLAMPLYPWGSNSMFGRSSFYLHGDNQACNCSGSDGCIVICSHQERQIVADSKDRMLRVIA